MSGRHKEITLSFMLVGHTKFAPDWCFGLFKHKFRRTFVSSLEEVADVVNKSADVNVAQLVGTQAGEPIVPVYDWAFYFGGHFRTVPQLKLYHHSNSQPGTVVLKEFMDSVEKSYTLVVDDEWSTELPLVIKSSGLSLSRQWYLFAQISEYGRPGTEDLTCPKPQTGVEQETEESTSAPIRESVVVPPPKKVRKCGKCGMGGHTRKTCKLDNNDTK